MKKYYAIFFALICTSFLMLVMPSFAQAQTGSEMLKTADAAVTRITSIIDRGGSLLNEAREASDVARMDCINTLLVTATGFLTVAQNGNTNLRDALSRDDLPAQQHHYKLIQLATDRSNSIEANMLQCGASIAEVSGETRLETTRTCRIEPCLSTELDDSLTNPPADTLLDSIVDASPFR